jgi:hypothetical protein
VRTGVTNCRANRKKKKIKGDARNGILKAVQGLRRPIHENMDNM